MLSPQKRLLKLDFNAIVDKAQGLSDEIDAIEDDYLTKRYEKAQKSVERLREKMKNMRSDGLEDEGIYSVENMAFKLLRNSGQIGKLMNLGNDSYDSELSDSKKGKIRVNIVQNVDEKKKKTTKKEKKKPRKEGIMAFITHMVVSKTHFPVIPVMVETAVGVVSNYLVYDHRI